MGNDFFNDITKTTKKGFKRVSYSVNSEVIDNFNKIAKNKKYNKSKIIENFLRKFVEQEMSLV